MRIPQQVSALVAGLLALSLTHLTGTDASTALTVALITVALGVLLHSDAGPVLLAAHATVRARSATAARPPRPTGSGTDPVHHPLRPRAPGRC